MILGMTIGEIYELAIKMGIDADPRGKKGVEKYLARQKKVYEDLPKSKKEDFDLESHKNPYSDTRILFGDPKTKVKKVMAGIDFAAGGGGLGGKAEQKREGKELGI